MLNRKEELDNAIDEIINTYLEKLPEDEKLRTVFSNTYASSAKSTVEFLENGEVFMLTGDIPAMWLRDSSAQVVHYLDFMEDYPILNDLVSGLIKRQMRYINIDPYANAFNIDDSELRGHHTDETDFKSKWQWERKYEIDSLCYPVWLLNEYWQRTKDESIFNDVVEDAFNNIIDVWTVEQNHETESEYFFMRDTTVPTDTLVREGKGAKTAHTGMTWSGFRPSDDACDYGYLVPANMFAVVALDYIQKFAAEIFKNEDLANRAQNLRNEIEAGINNHAIVEDEDFGKIYAYETDGLGNYNLMDDANVPSLLSIPWLRYRDNDDEIYQNTRKFILSKKNPFFYEGEYAKGIGSPHTPKNYIWHIALSMQGLTARTREEKLDIIDTLLKTDGGTDVMHEGFDPNNPSRFTREWFAWSNSLFASLVMDVYK